MQLLQHFLVATARDHSTPVMRQCKPILHVTTFETEIKKSISC